MGVRFRSFRRVYHFTNAATRNDMSKKKLGCIFPSRWIAHRNSISKIRKAQRNRLIRRSLSPFRELVLFQSVKSKYETYKSVN